jgi:hypothetical protein
VPSWGCAGSVGRSSLSACSWLRQRPILMAAPDRANSLAGMLDL